MLCRCRGLLRRPVVARPGPHHDQALASRTYLSTVVLRGTSAGLRRPPTLSAAASQPPGTADDLPWVARAFSTLSISSHPKTSSAKAASLLTETGLGGASCRGLSTQTATASLTDLPPNLVLVDPSIVLPKPPAPELPPPSFEVPVQLFTTTAQDGDNKEGAAPPPVTQTVSLDRRVFGVPIRKDIIHEVVTWQRAKRRCALAATKRVSEIRGSTKKARQQKGTGRARAGKKRAPQFRGGYKPHGPRQRDFSYKLNKKVRALGLRVALSAKLLERNLVIVDNLDIPAAKTKLVASIIAEKEWGRTLFIDDEVDDKLRLAVGNLQAGHVLPQVGANVLDMVKAQTLVLTRAALASLTARLTQDL